MTEPLVLMVELGTSSLKLGPVSFRERVLGCEMEPCA